MNDLLASGVNFQMAHGVMVKFLEWVHDNLAKTPVKTANLTAAQRSVLERIIEIAQPFGRWDIHLDTLEPSSRSQSTTGPTCSTRASWSKKPLEFETNWIYWKRCTVLLESTSNSKTRRDFKPKKDYFSHSVEEGHTLAIERLMELEYWLGRTENYLQQIDAYNGPFTKVVRMVEYDRRRKFQRGLRKNAIFQKGREFRGKLLETAKEATGPWAEAMALGAVLKPYNLAFHRSNDEKMADLTRIIELETSMGSKKNSPPCTNNGKQNILSE